MGLGLLGTALAGGLQGAGEVAKGYIKEEADLNLEQRRAEIEAQRQETLRHWSDQADQRRAAREDARNVVTDQFARDKFAAERSDAAVDASLKERELELSGRETPADALAKHRLGLMTNAPGDLNSEEGRAWLAEVRALRAVNGEERSNDRTETTRRNQDGSETKIVTYGAGQVAKQNEGASPNGLFNIVQSAVDAENAARAEQGGSDAKGGAAQGEAPQSGAGTNDGAGAKASSAIEDRMIQLTGQRAQLSHLPKDNPQVQYLDEQIDVTSRLLAQEPRKQAAEQTANKSKEAGKLSRDLSALTEQRKLLKGRLAEGSPALREIDQRIIRIREALNKASR